MCNCSKYICLSVHPAMHLHPSIHLSIRPSNQPRYSSTPQAERNIHTSPALFSLELSVRPSCLSVHRRHVLTVAVYRRPSRVFVFGSVGIFRFRFLCVSSGKMATAVLCSHKLNKHLIYSLCLIQRNTHLCPLPRPRVTSTRAQPCSPSSVSCKVSGRAVNSSYIISRRAMRCNRDTSVMTKGMRRMKR